jgi:hypothetical protein
LYPPILQFSEDTSPRGSTRSWWRKKIKQQPRFRPITGDTGRGRVSKRKGKDNHVDGPALRKNIVTVKCRTVDPELFKEKVRTTMSMDLHYAKT